MKVESAYGYLKTLVDYFYGIFIGNLMFLISNLPILIIIYFSLPPRSLVPSTLELYLCLLPVGPAFTALLYAMNRMVYKSDISVIRNFWKSYRINFRQALIAWGIISLFIVLLSIDIRMSNSIFLYLQIIFLIMLVFESIYVMALLSRFQTTLKKVVAVAFYSIFSQFKETLLILFMFIFVLMFLFIKPSVAIMVIISGLAALIMIILKDYLTEFE